MCVHPGDEDALKDLELLIIDLYPGQHLLLSAVHLDVHSCQLHLLDGFCFSLVGLQPYSHFFGLHFGKHINYFLQTKELYCIRG
jgi:hypothetical protein